MSDILANRSDPDAMLCLIDARTAEDAEGFKQVLNIVESQAMNEMIQTTKDFFGVAFYNTRHSPLPKEKTDDEMVVPTNTAIFTHLTAISSSKLSDLKALKDSNNFEVRYGRSSSENLAEGLWLCTKMFTKCSRRLQNSRIVLFTNNHNPYQNDPTKADECHRYGMNLRMLGITFVIIPIVDDFDMDCFYRKFVCDVNGLDEENYEFPEPSDQRERFSSRVFHQQHRSGFLKHFNWTIARDLVMSCGLYAFAKDFKRPQKVLLDRDNRIVVSKNRCSYETLDEATGEMRYDMVLPGDQRKVLEAGGQRIILTPVEVNKLKRMVEPGMKLLGFKPMSRLPLNCAIKRSRLAYPDDTNIKGSTQLFHALWQKCIDKEKFAMCVFTETDQIVSRYVALVPQQRELYGADGFRILYVPMQSDIRNVEMVSEIPEIPDEDMEAAMEGIVTKLRWRYHTLPDPLQQAFHATLEALVFGEEKDIVDASVHAMIPINRQDELIQPFVDVLLGVRVQDIASPSEESGLPNEPMPELNTELIAETNAESVAGQMGESFAGQVGEAVAGQMGETITPPIAEPEPSTQPIAQPNIRERLRPRQARPVQVHPNQQFIVKALRRNNLRAVTIEMLKDFLRSEGVHGYSGKDKPDLVQMVKEHLNL